MTPRYLADQSPVSMVTVTYDLLTVASGHHPCQSDVTRVRLYAYGGRAFSLAGPSAWNQACVQLASVLQAALKHLT